MYLSVFFVEAMTPMIWTVALGEGGCSSTASLPYQLFVNMSGLMVSLKSLSLDFWRLERFLADKGS